ncbi:MAG TPA: hypothetical protein VNK91_08615 [Burkholderiaceae bacterium]|jgi:hypothetical protein|nr:hypothetical protein [Burkholderiaceae bacterium]
MSAAFDRIALALLAGAALLAACGGGGNGDGNPASIAQAQLIVEPGDPNAVFYYGDSPGGPGGGDGGASAGSGDGGPGLGRFRNALVRVELADGRIAGEAEIDAKRGVVRVDLKGYAGPVRFTVRAKPDGSTTYYEEAKRQFVKFPLGSEMNAVVPKFDKNVGITLLTEAAWRHLNAKHGANGWKDAARVAAANALVRDAFNAYLPAAYKVSDITRLPWLLSDTTKAGEIPATENGNYGIVISGIGVAAGLFQPDDEAPALRWLAQLPLDFCDGVLDGACNGTPLVTSSAEAAYSLAQLREFLAAGIDRVVASCGGDELRARLTTPRVLQVRVDATRDPFALRSYSNNTPIWLLRNDGQVLFWSTRQDKPVPYAGSLLFRQLFTQGPLLGATFSSRTYDAAYRIADPQQPRDAQAAAPLAPSELAVYRGVDMLAALDFVPFDAQAGGLGQIVRKQDGRAYEEREIFGLKAGDLRDSGVGAVIDVGVAGYNRAQGANVASGGRAFYAVRERGEVFSWGYNTNYQLGIGNDDFNLFLDKPAQIPNFLVRAVTGHLYGAYAIDFEGFVHFWGREVHGLGNPSLRPVPAAELNKFAPIEQIECAEWAKCAARTRRGEMVVWGTFFEGAVDLGTRSTQPPSRAVAPTPVALPPGRSAVSVGAAGLHVYALLDNGDIVVLPTVPEKPAIVSVATADIDARTTGGMCTQ